MHLPTGATAVYQSGTATSCGGTDWSLSICKGGMLEPPSSNSSSSPPGSQDLWWTERLVVEAQQEFPGELSKFAFFLCNCFKLLRSPDLFTSCLYSKCLYMLPYYVFMAAHFLSSQLKR